MIRFWDLVAILLILPLLPSIILLDWLTEKERTKNRRLYGDGYYRDDFT